MVQVKTLVRDSKVALVSGANRGIGLEISRQLSERGIQVLMGSRNRSDGEKSVKLVATSKKQNALPVQLDVTDETSVSKLVAKIRKEFGRLDILVNNGAVLLDETDFPSETNLDVAKKTFETNVLGAWRLCKAFVPIMKERGYGRIVNVSSSAGQLSSVQAELYSPAYSLSKASLNVLTMMFGRELKGTNILVNSMDPGWVRTDMGGRTAPRSVEEGADTAIFLATLPDGGPNGSFFRDRRKIAW